MHGSCMRAGLQLLVMLCAPGKLSIQAGERLEQCHAAQKKQRAPRPFVVLQREGGKLGHGREKLCWHAGLLPLGHKAMQLVWPGLAWSWACWTATVGFFFLAVKITRMGLRP